MTAMIATSAPLRLVGPTTSIGMSPDQIVALHRRRKNKAMKVLAAGKRVQQVYDGEWETALPELEARERTQVANMLLEGVEQNAMRIASTDPTVKFPPENNSGAARKRADDRRQIIEAWHFENKMKLLRRSRARQLIAFATSPVWIRPGGANGVPVWEMWDALNTFPSNMRAGEMVPDNVVYEFQRSWAQIQNDYMLGSRLPLGKNQTPDTMVDCLMYADAYEMVLIAIAKDSDGEFSPTLCQRVPNLAGRPCVIVPGRITLGRLQGQFDQMIGMYEAQGLLWAMHLQALKRSIFAETWLEARPNEDARIIVPADPVRGTVGQVEGGALQTYRADPSVQTGQTMDRLERSQRLNGGVPAEFGGESGSNIRTARRGSQVLSSAVDFPIQEHQDILAAANMEENKVAIAIAKAYGGDTERTLLVPFGDGQVTYKANDAFPVDTHQVAYPFSGVSADGLVVEILQRVGAGEMSLLSAMEVDPLIDDAKYEHQRVIVEQVEKAHLAAIQQQASDPNGPYTPENLSRLTQLLVEKQMPLYEAEAQLHKEIQAKQQKATEGQLPPEQMQPGNAVAGAPGTPGAANPGQPAPTPTQEGLASLLGSMRNIQRGVPQQPAPGNV